MPWREHRRRPGRRRGAGKMTGDGEASRRLDMGQRYGWEWDISETGASALLES